MQSSAATTPNIAQRCSYAHTKFAQQIPFTVGHPADLDSAYFSESESVKIAYYRHCKVHSSGNPTKLKCNLQTTSSPWTMLVGDHGLLSPDTRFTAVTHRFRNALSFGKVNPPIWLRQSGTFCAPSGHIYIISKKTCLTLI